MLPKGLLEELENEYELDVLSELVDHRERNGHVDL